MFKKLKPKIRKRIESIKPLWKIWLFMGKIKRKINNLFIIYLIKKYENNIKLDSTFNEKINLSSKKIHFVYFTCNKHFNYFIKSIKSLKQLNLKNIGKIFLYADKKDFLNKNQLSKIKKIEPNIILKNTKFKNKVGPRRIISYLTAYKEISQKIGSNDYLTKLDSDTLFISSKIFKEVGKLNSMMIGQKESSRYPYVFIQGGCYFLNNKIIPIITNSILLSIMKKVSKSTFCYINECPSDATIYSLVKKQTNKIKFIDFYLPLNKIDNITKKDKEKYSVIHFENKRIDRDKMMEVNKQIFENE